MVGGASFWRVQYVPARIPRRVDQIIYCCLRRLKWSRRRSSSKKKTACLSIRSVETFPGKVRGTADPSASLGMTKKERIVARRGRPLKERAIAKRVYPTHHRLVPWQRSSLWNSPLLFVIPSVPRFPASLLSPATTDVVLSKENHTQLTEAATLDRKSGEAEGSAVPRTSPGNVFFCFLLNGNIRRRRQISVLKPLFADALGDVLRRELIQIGHEDFQSGFRGPFGCSRFTSCAW